MMDVSNPWLYHFTRSGGTERPSLTVPRARLLAALSRYIRTAWRAGVSETPRASLVEVHKVAYLLQSAGSELHLQFVSLHYGPFSNALNQALAGMEGHYLLGYGDGTGGARADIRLTDGTADAAEDAVREDGEFDAVWQRIERAIFGYEYPDGMELLTSVHYLATRPDAPADRSWVMRGMAEWSPRKRRLFQSGDVVKAWERLHEVELLPPAQQ